MQYFPYISYGRESKEGITVNKQVTVFHAVISENNHSRTLWKTDQIWKVSIQWLLNNIALSMTTRKPSKNYYETTHQL